MAKVKTASFVERFKSALEEKLAEAGIPAEVQTEKVATTRLHRVLVLAPKFKKLKHTERQDLVWRIADQALSPDEQLLISMIVTLTPDEAEGK